MSKSLKESDFTRGRECVKYAYEKLEIIKQDADDMRLNPSIVIFLQEIMQVLGSTHAKYRLDVIVPESIKPDYLRYHGHFSDRRLAAAASVVIIEKAPGVGDKGGKCTCPDGNSYDVGAIGDDCKTLACVGGTTSGCENASGVWSKKKVMCGQEKVTLDIQKNFKMADKRKDKNPWKFIMTRSKDRGIHLKDWQKTGFNKIEIPASSMMLNANFFLLAITMLA